MLLEALCSYLRHQPGYCIFVRINLSYKFLLANPPNPFSGNSFGSYFGSYCLFCLSKCKYE